MANSYHKVYLHFVFAARYRDSQLVGEFKGRMERYLSAITVGEGHHVHAIFCMPDHVHLLVGFRITQSIPDFARLIKTNSSRWVNQEARLEHRFAWQDGYGVFSHGQDSLSKAIHYIQNQEEHHQKRTFQQEYLTLLRRFEIDFDERFVFGPME